MITKKNEAFLRVDPYLREHGVDDDLRNIIFSIAHAGKYVAHSLRSGDLGYSQTQNASGESQLELDVIADSIFCNHLASTSKVGMFASEEQSKSKEIECEEKECFSVAFDPLDGSSLVSANFSIGSIFSIFRGKGFLGKKGKDMAAAGYIVYGPRTILVVATDAGVFEFSENGLGEFILSRKDFSLHAEAKYIAPGNLRAVTERKKYKSLIDKWAKEQKTLRYSGGMVPDIHMMLSKGSGIFCYPAHSKHPKGKLRLLYECAPFAFIMEKCGGMAVDESGKRILDIPVEELHQRTTIFIGSKNEVKTAVKILRER